MSQVHLSSLAILPSENALAKEIDFYEDISSLQILKSEKWGSNYFLSSLRSI